jgi:hypothetical protein
MSSFGVCPGAIWFLDFILQREALIPEALKQQYDIGKSVVHSQNDHGREHPLHHRTEDIEEISKKPYRDEDYREAVCRTSSPVLNDLGREYHCDTLDNWSGVGRLGVPIQHAIDTEPQI